MESTTHDPPNDAGDSPNRRAPGPAKAYLAQQQRYDLLNLLENGKGLDKSLRQLEISYRTYRNTIADEPDFLAEVKSAQRASINELEEFGRMLAMERSDEELLVKMLERHDRCDTLTKDRRDRQTEIAQKRDFVTEQKALDRAHQLELAKIRQSKPGSVGESGVGIALKVLSILIPHVDPAKLPEISKSLAAEMPNVDAHEPG